MSISGITVNDSTLFQLLSSLDEKDLFKLWERCNPGQHPSPVFSLREHFFVAAQMFPISKFPEVWERIFGGITPKSSFDETKAGFIDQFSQDSMVTIDDDQAWDLMQIKDNHTIAYKIRNPRRLGRGCTIQ